MRPPLTIKSYIAPPWRIVAELFLLAAHNDLSAAARKIVAQSRRPKFDDGRSQLAILSPPPFNMLDFRSSITITAGESS